METIIPEPLKVEYNQEKLVLPDTISVEFSDTNLRGIVNNFCKQAADITGLPSNSSLTDSPLVIIELEKSELLNDFPATATPEKRYALEIYDNHIYVTSETVDGIKAGLTTLLQILEGAEKNADGEIEIPGRVILDAPKALH